MDKEQNDNGKINEEVNKGVENKAPELNMEEEMLEEKQVEAKRTEEIKGKFQLISLFPFVTIIFIKRNASIMYVFSYMI